MFLSYLMLVVALALSAIAAFYSIVGLAAIFAAAVMPIVIMGSILEIAKITVTIWLHEYWSQCRLLMKMYLVPAVFTLMVITSMGIFGFLSKAHLDQVVPTGDVQAQVVLIDEKIANERDTIANARTLLGQLDRAVTDIGSAPDREVNGRVISSAERALQVRRQQARDRAQLTQTIEQAQQRIVKLQEEKAPFAKDLRKIEAEVGPVKYIAALIYGDNPDTNLLEKAVRWVIIILVAVFDPLAIMMLLAATESMKWERQTRDARKEEEQTDDRSISDPPQPTTGKSGPGEPEPDSGTHPDQPPDSDPPVAQQPDPGDNIPVRPHGTDGDQPSEDDRPNHIEPGQTVYVDWHVEPTVEHTAEPTQASKPDRAQDDLDIPVLENEETWAQRVIDEHDAEKEAMREWKRTHPNSTIKEQRRLAELGMIDHLPWQASVRLEADNEARASEVRGFGIEFPREAVKGDQFLRVDMLPTRLYKFNGNKWVEIDKNLSDQYVYDEEYINHLIKKISDGEYDADLLSDAERDQITKKLQQP